MTQAATAPSDPWGFAVDASRAAEALALARWLELRAEAIALFLSTYGDAVQSP